MASYKLSAGKEQTVPGKETCNEMLTAFRIDKGRLVTDTSATGEECIEGAQWIDIVAISDEERRQVETVCDISLPTLEDVDELEASAHHVSYPNEFQINRLFFHQLDGEPRNSNMSIVYDGTKIITLCSREVPHTRLPRIRNHRGLTQHTSPLSILFSLLEIKVDGLADEMEGHTRISRKSAEWFSGESARNWNRR